MKKVLILFSLLLLITLTGCTTQPPLDNPSFFAPINSVAPFNCNQTVEGYIYYNNVIHKPYICNSTDWTKMVN